MSGDTDPYLNHRNKLNHKDKVSDENIGQQIILLWEKIFLATFLMQID